MSTVGGKMIGTRYVILEFLAEIKQEAEVKMYEEYIKKGFGENE